MTENGKVVDRIGVLEDWSAEELLDHLRSEAEQREHVRGYAFLKSEGHGAQQTIWTEIQPSSCFAGFLQHVAGGTCSPRITPTLCRSSRREASYRNSPPKSEKPCP